LLSFSLSVRRSSYFCFSFHASAPSEFYSLSLHDALPILPRKSARSHSGRPVPGWCPLARLQYSFAEAWYRADHPHSQRIVFAPLAGTDPLQDRNRSHSPQGIFTQTSTPSTRRLMFVPLRPQLEQEKRPSRRSAHWSQKGQRTSTESHFR